jgi:hypothetical protein
MRGACDISPRRALFARRLLSRYRDRPILHVMKLAVGLCGNSPPCGGNIVGT